MLTDPAFDHTRLRTQVGICPNSGHSVLINLDPRWAKRRLSKVIASLAMAPRQTAQLRNRGRLSPSGFVAGPQAGSPIVESRSAPENPAGSPQIAFMSLAAAAGAIKGGSLRAFAITSAKRSEVFPEIPTMAEAGIPDQQSAFWQGMVFPAGTPQEIIDRWHRGIAKVLATPDMQKLLAGMSFEPVINSPQEFSALIKSEIEKWRKVIELTNIKKLDH
jgi:hypothetical protein